MTKWAAFYSTEYLTAESLDEKGRTATIAAVEAATLRSDESAEEHSAAAVTFKETATRWLVNKVNRLCLEAMFGANVEDAIGHKVTLFQDACEIRGQYYGKPCIRVLGSPELAKAMTVTIKLPRRKPFTRTLVPTGPATPVNANGRERPSEGSGGHASVDGGTEAQDADLDELDAFAMDADAAKAQSAAHTAAKSRAKAAPGTFEEGEL